MEFVFVFVSFICLFGILLCFFGRGRWGLLFGLSVYDDFGEYDG